MAELETKTIEAFNLPFSSSQEAIETARSLAPRIRERRDQARRDRRVPDETIRELKEAGLLRALTPKVYGGFELDHVTFSEILREIGRACGSTGWVLSVLGGHNSLIARGSKQAQDDVWGKTPDAVASATLMPTGTAEPVEGGYLVSGRYPFASGSDHADWHMFGCPEEGVGVAAYLVPIEEVEFIEDWDVLGLEATGSRSVKVEKVFVPEHRKILLDPESYKKVGLHDNPNNLVPADLGHAGLTSVLIGVAETAMDEFAAGIKGAKRMFKPLDSSEATQIAFAESTAEVHAARIVLREFYSQLQAALDQGVELDPVQHQSLRRDCVFALRMATRAVDRLHAHLGGRAIYSKHPLGTSFCDLHAGLGHMGHSFELGAIPYAQLRLGATEENTLWFSKAEIYKRN